MQRMHTGKGGGLSIIDCKTGHNLLCTTWGRLRAESDGAGARTCSSWGVLFIMAGWHCSAESSSSRDSDVGMSFTASHLGTCSGGAVSAGAAAAESRRRPYLVDDEQSAVTFAHVTCSVRRAQARGGHL
jgi:hypothetical protein